ncbi:MAG: hypothetical protein JST54_14500 [Deltaproteobacteria bacterium]|nr:hypothetical protein [Deltaproteobacteria bacterium]
MPAGIAVCTVGRSLEGGRVEVLAGSPLFLLVSDSATEGLVREKVLKRRKR